jgi:effector-binding domain-containing protein
MYSIGEFSLITRLSVKTLRHYHEEGILVPDYIDEDSGYRYYRDTSIERAVVIAMLRGMEFSISDIKEIFFNKSDDIEILEYLESHKIRIIALADKYRDLSKELDSAIKTIRRNEMKENMSLNIEEKTIEDFTFAGFRFTGTYDQIGNAFSAVGKNCGRFIYGKALGLYYNDEYKEKDADIEGGFPVKPECTAKDFSKKNIKCRTLAGGRAVTLIHCGSYDTLGKSYQRLLDYIRDKGYKTKSPSREIYHKGPGMIFTGNPEKYITEIQFLIS